MSILVALHKKVIQDEISALLQNKTEQTKKTPPPPCSILQKIILNYQHLQKVHSLPRFPENNVNPN